jgi:2-polyprenyl-3-methyl-5-hydroxy-6-metoxy-1,4-benzoquinol methylase
MAENRLKIVSVTTENATHLTSKTPRRAKEKEAQAKFERLWLIDPEQFNPLRNCMEKERLGRTWALLTKHTRLTGRRVADIGCAGGVFSRRLRDAGAEVEAIDIAENALKRFKETDAVGIELKQEAMPSTRLPDHQYDLIICTELIAEIDRENYRLFFSELARLIKPDGWLVCSSPIDIDSEGGVEKLKELALAEFDIIDETISYHALYLRMKRFFSVPSKFIACWQNPAERMKKLTSTKGLRRT